MFRAIQTANGPGLELAAIRVPGATTGQVMVHNGTEFRPATLASSASGCPLPVRIATAVNDSLSGLGARDGVTPVSGDRVLVRAQSSGADNGIYVASSGAWTRATDFDTSSEVVGGVLVYVQEGTLNGQSVWELTNTGTITVGTTAQTWARGIASGTFANGDGLSGVNILRMRIGSSTFMSLIALDASNNPTFGDTTDSTHAQTNYCGRDSINFRLNRSGTDRDYVQFADTGLVFQQWDTGDGAMRAQVTMKNGEVILGKRDASSSATGLTTRAPDKTGTDQVTVTCAIRSGLGTGSGAADNGVDLGGGIPGSTGTTQHTVGWSARATGRQFKVLLGTVFATRAVTSFPDTATINDTVLMIGSSGARTQNLPAVATVGAGAMLMIVDRDGNAAAGNITIDGNASETINGATTYVINTDRGGVLLICTGSAWNVIAKF